MRRDGQSLREGRRLGSSHPTIRKAHRRWTSRGCQTHWTRKLLSTESDDHMTRGIVTPQTRAYDSSTVPLHSTTRLRTERTSWSSDVSSPWMRRHTDGSRQDTHGTPLPSLLEDLRWLTTTKTDTTSVTSNTCCSDFFTFLFLLLFLFHMFLFTSSRPILFTIFPFSLLIFFSHF